MRDLVFVGRPGLDPGTLGLKGHRVHYSLFIKFREPHIYKGLRSVRSVSVFRGYREMLGMKLGIFPPDPGVRNSTTGSAQQGIIPPPQ